MHACVCQRCECVHNQCCVDIVHWAITATSGCRQLVSAVDVVCLVEAVIRSAVANEPMLKTTIGVACVLSIGLAGALTHSALRDRSLQC
jgi:hypothetical protein